MSDEQDRHVQQALTAMRGAAASFAGQFIQDAKARASYNEAAQKFSSEIWTAYKSGRLTAAQAAEAAHQMRNSIMELTRAKLSPIGRAYSESLKKTGLLFDDLLEKSAKKLFQKSFRELGEADKIKVFEEVVKASGRANPKVTASARRLGRLGTGLWVIAVGISLYNIAVSDNMVRQAFKEVVSTGTAIGGGVAGAEVGAAICGPWCAAAGALIGGVLGAIIGETIFDALADAPPSRSECDISRRPCYLGGGAVIGEDGIVRQVWGAGAH